MPVVIPVQFGIARWSFSLSGDPEPMVFTCGVEGATGVTTQAVSDVCYNAYVGAFPVGSTDNAYTFNGTSVSFHQPGGMQVATTGPARVGTNSSANPPPNNCALLVKKVTGFSDRKQRGRFYLPNAYVDEASIDRRGFVVAGSVTTVQGWLNTFFTTLTGGPTVISARILHSDATSPTVISSLQLQSQMATQRRRMRK